MIAAPSIRVLIVDDEPLAREGIRQLLAADERFEIVAECGDGASAIKAIARQHPDVVFLDVQMPEHDGFEVLRRLPEDQIPLVVFVTAYDKFAVQAFETHALDYVVKPIDRGRFAKTLTRIKERLQEKEVSAITRRLVVLLGEDLAGRSPTGRRASYLERVPIKAGDRIYFVDATDIDWIEAEDYYASLHTGKQSHLVRMSLSALEEKLDPAKFTRIHRSTIVNISRVKELRRHFRGNQVAILQDGTRLTLSRSYQAKARAALGQPE